MAIDTSHAAAKQYDRTFSVELLSQEEPATVLRTKKPSLAIVATTGGFR
jgi:hypothetical protein